MAIVSWASLGGGQLLTAEQRKKWEKDPNAGRGFYNASENDLKVSVVLEKMAEAKNATLQDIVSLTSDAHRKHVLTAPQALAYLFHQSTHVFPLVGVQTVEQVKLLLGALSVKLSSEEVEEIHDAAPFNPLFPNNFLFECKYNTRLTVADQVHYQMATWIDAPPKQPVSLLLANGFVTRTDLL